MYYSLMYQLLLTRQRHGHLAHFQKTGGIQATGSSLHIDVWIVYPKHLSLKE